MAQTPPIIPGVPPIASGPSGVASQQNPPPQPQLPPGTVVQGNVAGADAKGNPIIQNQSLQLVLSTRFALPQGAQVAVRIDPPVTRESMPTFRILSIDGKPPVVPPPTATAPASPAIPPAQAAQAEQAKPVGVLLEVLARPTATDGRGGQAATTTNAQTQPPAQAANTRGMASEVTLSAGEKITAVLLRPAVSTQASQLLTQLAQQLPAAGATPSAPTQNMLRVGLQLQVQVVQMTAQPAMSNVPTTNMASPSQADASAPMQWKAGYAQYAKQAPAQMSPTHPHTQQPSAPHSTATPSPPSVSPNAASSALAPMTAPVNIAANLTPQTVELLLARAESQALPQGQLAAVVIGREPNGAALLQTRLGMFALPQVQAANAAPGSVLVLQVNAMKLPASPSQMLPLQGAGGVLSLAAQSIGEWSALHELSSLLQGMQSTMATQAMQQMMPHASGQFSAGLFLFMTMLRKGDISEWMGRDMMEQLERLGKGDVLQRLSAEMSAVRPLFTEPQPGSWQALFFPVVVEKQLEQARLFVKQDNAKNREGGGGVRFIVELELSHLGPMQMDGLVKKRSPQTRFDLVIRTMRELPAEMQNDIYDIFAQAQQVTGLEGSMNFRVVQEFPVHPLQEIEAEQGGEGSIIA